MEKYKRDKTINQNQIHGEVKNVTEVRVGRTLIRVVRAMCVKKFDVNMIVLPGNSQVGDEKDSKMQRFKL